MFDYPAGVIKRRFHELSSSFSVEEIYDFFVEWYEDGKVILGSFGENHIAIGNARAHASGGGSFSATIGESTQGDHVNGEGHETALYRNGGYKRDQMGGAAERAQNRRGRGDR
jgi:hypothetical protein